MIEIKIKVDPEKKQILGIEGADKVDPIQLSVIMQQISIQALSNITIQPEEKIKKPTDKQILTVAGARG
jgi:hypothetical protein